MKTYLATFGYCIVSALLPFVNAEGYLVAISAVTRPPNLWLLAFVAAAGQMVGKTIYYYAGRGSVQLPRLMRRKQKQGRWSVRFARWRQRAENQPLFAAVLVLISAFAGLPPFAAISVFAGLVRLPVWAFVPIGVVGRYGRFLVCLLVPNLWHYLSVGG